MSKRFDATVKGLLEFGPEDWPALAGYPQRRVEVVDADVSTFTGASDKVLRVHDLFGDWLLDVNFQSGPDASLPGRMHLYNALLEYRHGLPVRSVAILLAPKTNLAAINGYHARQFPDEPPHLEFRYRVIRVWELPVAPLLAGGLGTLPLAPVSAVTEQELPGIIAQMKSRITAPGVLPAAKDLWTATYILMGLRYEPALVDHLLQGVIEMEESSTYQAILEKGELRRAHKTLLLLGTDRFGAPSAEVQTVLEGINEPDKLDHLSLHVSKVHSWEELLQQPH
jgi:predicted transposase YdaD